VITAERVKLSRVAPEGKDARAPHASTAAKATSAMTASVSATRRAGWACREWVCSLEDLGSGVSEEEKSDEEAKQAGDLEAWPAFARATAPEATPPRSPRARDKRCVWETRAAPPRETREGVGALHAFVVVFAKTRRPSAREAFPCRKARRGGPRGARAAETPTATILILPAAGMRGARGCASATRGGANPAESRTGSRDVRRF
jgi:hypothetical protein